jgi:hypothetical protein
VSEYAFFSFRAIDGCLNDEQLRFAQRQSSRAEVTRRSLTVEYHYSSFHGDIHGLLRRGFDIYLHYANYGVSEIKLRLPQGLPFAEDVLSDYLSDEKLIWEGDTSGRGGILSICPFHDLVDHQPLLDAEPVLDAAAQIRKCLISGDLRALYVLWLCSMHHNDVCPGETFEPPVPHGLADMLPHGGPLLSFFGLDELILKAAAEGLPPAPGIELENQSVALWVATLDEQKLRQSLVKVLTDDSAAEKTTLLAEFGNFRAHEEWPRTNRKLSLEQLYKRTELLRAEAEAGEKQRQQQNAKQKAEQAERDRAIRMQKMLADPDHWLRETDKLAAARGTDNYKAAADILYDLREVIGGLKGKQLAQSQAAKLVHNYPTLGLLKSNLRKRGLLE